MKLGGKPVLGCLGMNFALFISKGRRKVPNQGGLKGNCVRESSNVMDKTNIENKLNELMKEFGGMSNPGYSKLAMLAKQAHDGHKQLQKSVDSLQESLDYLRICIKYQLFDLEATRRENEYLRGILEERDS